MPYVELDGIDHYYEVHGAGDPVLLLHGGFCSLETMASQIAALSTSYRVHAPERPGQGRTADREGPMTFEGMVADTVAYLDALGVQDAHVIGFSDGAITGLMLAMEHPERVRSLVSISANLDPGGFVDDDDVPEEVPASVSATRDAYDRLSPDGPEHADVVLEKLGTLWRAEPHIDPATLSRIVAPTMIMAGDRDSIRTSHTVDIAAAIPGAQLAILPGAGHMVMEDRSAVVNQLIEEFLEGLHARTD
jgi:pimeloyl-ACP methyl ester carboxylesterase